MTSLASPGHFKVLAQRIMQRCEQLAALSAMPDGVARYYLTPEHKAANAVLQNWLQLAGLRTWEDAAANIWGRYPSDVDNAPTVILGSHLDTVANAGKYDGILGVVTALAVVELLAAHNIRLPFHIDVVGFGDEEGVRFGTTLLGSCAVAGKWQPAWFELQDSEGTSLRQALHSYLHSYAHSDAHSDGPGASDSSGAGMNSLNIESASRAADNVLAYIELHIEQGPLLEHKDLPVGVVTAIAGAKRYRFTLTGMAGHAGTVPMHLRRDPLVAAAAAITAIETLAKSAAVVATVGSLQVLPGAVNVIAGHCEFTLDIRSASDTERDRALQTILVALREICRERNIKLDIQPLHSANSVACAKWLRQKSAAVIEDFGYPVLELVSGAGHDAMVFSDMTDIAMLFVRCAGGVSHNPLESVTVKDVEVALGVYYSLVLSLVEDTASGKSADRSGLQSVPD